MVKTSSFACSLQPIKDWQLMLVVGAIALLDQCIAFPLLMLGIINGESVTPVPDLFQDHKLNVSNNWMSYYTEIGVKMLSLIYIESRCYDR